MDNNDSNDSSASKDKSDCESPVRIKDEPPDDIKDYAENTMNELLGWYGYDKVNSADTQDLNLERYTASGPEEAASPDDISVDGDDDSLCSDGSLSDKSDFSKLSLSRSNSETSLAAQHRNLVSALTKKHGLTGAPDGTLPSGYITCAWCQKPGVKLFTLRTSTTTKAFCSEVCFTQCRRASFKKNKVCDWCKHVRHTVNYVDFQDGEQQLQFCSSKCLNQYKMKIFCKETQEHLQQIQNQTERATSSKSPDKQILITPDLWMKESKGEKKHKEKRTSSETGDRDDKDKVKASSKSDWKSESRKSSLTSPASLCGDRDKLSPSHRTIYDRVSRERHRRSSSKDSGNLASPPYNIRDNSPSSGGRNTNSALFSNTGFPAMPQWLPPHIWNAFGPGLSPMGPIPPWFYSGIFPPPGFIPPGAAQAPENLIRQSNSRVSTPTPNRAMMSPDTSNSSPSSTPNTPKTPTSRHNTSLSNNHSIPSVKHPVTTPSLGLGQPPPLLSVDPNAAPPPGMMNGMSHVPGMPPVTMIMPVPVPLPMPVPIPLPLPVKMEQLMEFFEEKKEQARKKEKLLQDAAAAAAKSAKSSSKHSHDKDLLDFKSSRLFSKSDINENGIEQRDCTSCTSFQTERSNSVYSCPDLSDSYSSVHDLSTHKRALTPRIDGSLDLTKKAKIEFVSNDSCDGVIDLSSKDGSKYKMSPGKENRDNNDSDISQEEGEVLVNGEYALKVPRIHIITPRSEPPLSQQLPLPPAEHKYSNRRGLILDAPCVPKRQRSPSPERRSYVRSVPRDVMEAARRRCLRARIRTK